MNTVATFEKVSWDQYLQACEKLAKSEWGVYIDWDNAEDVEQWEQQQYEDWKNIQLPERQTSGAAGYDFYSPINAVVSESYVTIPTGIRVKMDEGNFLTLVPRSSLGFKYGMRLRNTLGIIDADYYFSDNEGHIMARLVADEPFMIKPGDRFMQGILLPYNVATNGNKEATRNGGFGSTGN